MEPISNREMEIFRNAMPTNSLAPSVSTLDQKRLEQAFKEIQSLAGVLTNKERDMLSQANDPITLLTTLRDIKQNLISSGRLMSDTDKEIAMNAMPRQQSAAIMDMVGKTNGAISNREMEMFRNASPSMGTIGGGMGAISDREMEIFRDAVPDAVRSNKSLLSGVPDPMMSGVDTSIMQPLVEMGFEKTSKSYFKHTTKLTRIN
jgi:hypothetical protein